MSNGPHGRRARKALHRGVVWIHIVQLPLFFGLMVALILFAITFFFAIWDAVVTLDFLDRNGAILLVLDLLDMVFIANLIVMVMVSGYNASHAALSGGLGEEGQFSYTDEFQPVKSRIAATLVIISGIHLVHELLAGELEAPRDLLVLGALHLVLLTTAVAFAFIARFERRATRPPEPGRPRDDDN